MDINYSEGITPDATTATITHKRSYGILRFSCAENATGTKLKYTLSGTDAAAF